MSFNALSAVKFVVSGVVGIGAGKIAKSIIVNNMNAETLIDKVTTVAGAWAIGGMVAGAAKDYTDETIDETYAFTDKVMDAMKIRTKLNRIDRNESTFEKEGLDPSQYTKNDKGRWEPTKNKTDQPAES